MSIESKISSDVQKRLPKAILNKFQEVLPDIKDKAHEAYEELIFGTAVPKGSLANPEIFYESFINRLNAFEFIEEDQENVSLMLPTIDTFDFSGDLNILKLAIEGIVGSYYELPELDLLEILRSKEVGNNVKSWLRSLPEAVGGDVPLENRFRLIPSRGKLHAAVSEFLGKDLIVFPFSNSQPIEFFSPMHEFVEDNLDRWVDESVDAVIKEVKQGY